MPNFMFSRDAGRGDRRLSAGRHARRRATQWLAPRPLPTGIDPNDAALVARGKELVDSLGCRGCHGFAEDESPALLGTNKDIVPNLSQVAEKTDARWIYHWLKNPRGSRPCRACRACG